MATPPNSNGADALSASEKQMNPVSGDVPGAPTEKIDGVGQSSADDEIVNPPDFKGEVETNNEIPSLQILKRIEDHTVIDHVGKTHPFKSLYSGRNVARRILVIFIRHFFCGNCQEYLRTVASSITPEALLGLPVSTFIVVVGCGSHKLIDSYVKETGCPFPVYADPTRRLYQELGMVSTLHLGERPAYMQNKTVVHTVMSGIRQGLKQVTTGLVTKMGDQRQVGGEFLFEPASRTLETPISSPLPDDEGQSSSAVEEKRVTWCHRMRTTRDHAEIPELMEILGLDGDGEPAQDLKRWKKALAARKGTGLSMASQMGRRSVDTAKTAVAP
ncbi:AhpC/TSA antioxidant enzyme-domain-containing protein [Xylaria digitata]|nr:AhpC/TSA antioxidant enzyme-domain-containing protein [Xylaria digitata]